MISQQDRETVPFYTMPLNASAHSRVISLAWNPCDPTCIALAFTTGDLSLVKIKETSVEFSNKNDLLAKLVLKIKPELDVALQKRTNSH